ncbi:MAG TPA: hypothetical protein VFL97_06025 [Nitrococcus sp.]|nr:hypothetical protein [Nitrococcus sp.]
MPIGEKGGARGFELGAVVVHARFSTPFDTESGKALFDLQP